MIILKKILKGPLKGPLKGVLKEKVIDAQQKFVYNWECIMPKAQCPVNYGSPKTVPQKQPMKRTLLDSTRRMKELNFDPLDEQVELYRKMKDELLMFERMRRGELIRMASDGTEKIIHYSAVAHQTLYSSMQKLANDMMRYKYGRVPESIEMEIKDSMGMIINLHKDDASFKEISES